MHHGKNPYIAFDFVVEIGGANVAGFSEVDALTKDGDVIEYREGDGEAGLRKLRGLHKFNNIALKRGYTDSQDLWNWWRSARQGKAHRKSGVIFLLNEAREPVLKWAIKEARIKKWVGPPMNAETNEVAIESLEIVCQGVAFKS